MNGARYTDATGFRYGTMAVDLSGHAKTFDLLPGYKRFLYARAPIMLAPALGLAAVTEPWPTAAAGAGLATLIAKGVADKRRTKKFRAQVIEPLSAAVAAALRQKRVDGQGHLWINVPENYRDDPEARIRVALPADWLGADGDKAVLLRVVAAKLQLEDVAPTWNMHAVPPYVDLRVPPKPPKTVTFDEGLADLEGLADDELAMGRGARDKRETFSLSLESPHLLIAGGSGIGKSELLAYLVGQFMRRGYGVMVLDAKYVSHMWLRSVPGVAYMAESEELHEALVWLDGELTRRARFVAMGGDESTLVPLVAVLEEINTAANRLRTYWDSIKPTGAGQSPALRALANLASMGRELRIHILMAGQSLTAKSTGGPEARESFGGRALGGATSKQWAMLAPQIKPAPVGRRKPGRWHLVVGDTLKEFQVPFMDLKEKKTPGARARAIEWATGGQPVPDVVAMMAGQGQVVVEREVDIPSSGPTTCTLPDYDQARSVGLKRLENWRSQDRSGFPASAGKRGKALLYAWDDLDAYVGARLREDVKLD